MNRSALKNYAPKVRLDFIRAVTDRAAFFGLAPSVTDIPIIPGELFAKFQTSFYADPVDAVFKAMGVQ